MDDASEQLYVEVIGWWRVWLCECVVVCVGDGLMACVVVCVGDGCADYIPYTLNTLDFSRCIRVWQDMPLQVVWILCFECSIQRNPLPKYWQPCTSVTWIWSESIPCSSKVSCGRYLCCMWCLCSLSAATGLGVGRCCIGVGLAMPREGREREKSEHGTRAYTYTRIQTHTYTHTCKIESRLSLHELHNNHLTCMPQLLMRG